MVEKKESPSGNQGKKNVKDRTNVANIPDSVKATYYTEKLLEKGFVVDDYSEWLNHGFELASLGESGRELFHKISSTSSKYAYQDADKKFSDLLKKHNGRRTIGSFFRTCTDIHQIPKWQPLPTHRQAPKGIVGVTVTEDDTKWHYSLREVINHPVEPKVWGPFIKGGNNAIVASSEAGKTTLIRNLISAIILGYDTFLNWLLFTPRKKVIVVSSEDGIASAADFFRAILKDQSQDVYDNVQFIFDGYNLIERLVKLFEIHPADVVFIDTWGDAISGEYQSDTTRQKMQDIRKVCRLNDATPIYLHHTNKASENIPDKASVKGAGDFEQAMRCVLMLTIYKDSRWLCIAKSNDTPDHEKDIARELTYDPFTRRIDLTGHTESRKMIIQTLKKELYSSHSQSKAWSDILDDEKVYSYTTLKKIYCEATDVTERTAERKIKEAKESGDLKETGGKYHLPTYRHTDGKMSVDGLTGNNEKP